MKRIISVLLMAALAAGLAVLPAGAAGRVEVTLEPGKLKISDLNEGFSTLEFHNGLAVVRAIKDDKEFYGYADPTGEVVIPYQYAMATDFLGGSAVVTLHTDNPSRPHQGLIAPDGTYLLEPEYDITAPNDAWRRNTNMLYKVRHQLPNDDYYTHSGYVDFLGNFIVPLGRYDECGDFYDGTAWVRKEQQVSFINLSGLATPAFTLPESVHLSGDYEGGGRPGNLLCGGSAKWQLQYAGQAG